MNAESVALIPECAECDARWLPASETHWEAYLTDDEPPELAFFCPECVAKGRHEQGESGLRI